jgi:hypothetical protein
MKKSKCLGYPSCFTPHSSDQKGRDKQQGICKHIQCTRVDPGRLKAEDRESLYIWILAVTLDHMPVSVAKDWSTLLGFAIFLVPLLKLKEVTIR